jgi:hypothetical protein
MKKTLRYLLLAVLTTMFGAAQAQVNITATEIAGTTEKVDPFEYGTAQGFAFTADKKNGSSGPMYHPTASDLRIYAKGTFTIATTGATITKVVFNISTQGLKRLAPITASTGSIATQAAGDETVTWTGSASSFTVTVGDKANYGSDGGEKAGQLCFTSVDITYTGTPTVPSGEDPANDEEVTFDFTQNDYGMEHISDNQVYAPNPTTFSSGDVTATVTGDNGCRLWDSYTKQKDEEGNDMLDDEGNPIYVFVGTDFRLYKSGTLTLSVPSGQVIKKVVFTGSKVSKLNGPGNIPLEKATWEGALNAPSFTCSGTQEIKTITVTYGEGEEQQVVTTYTDYTIADLNATSEKSINNVNLKLNNALVVYVNGDNAFVREGDKAVQFFKMGDVEEGMTLTGDIKCDYSLYNGCPEVVGITDVTNLNDVQTGTATVSPTEATIAEINNNEHMADLVVLRDVKISIDDKNYYAVDATGAQVQIYDKYKLNSIPTEPGEEVYEVIGIFGTIYKNAPEIYVTAINSPGATAIQTIQTEQTDGAIYNLQGQRISQPARGLYIQNGRKYIAK